MKEAKSPHDKMVLNLEFEVYQKARVDDIKVIVFTEHDYDFGSIRYHKRKKYYRTRHGELDLLAVYPSLFVFDIYEMKTTKTKKSYAKVVNKQLPNGIQYMKQRFPSFKVRDTYMVYRAVNWEGYKSKLPNSEIRVERIDLNNLYDLENIL